MYSLSALRLNKPLVFVMVDCVMGSYHTCFITKLLISKKKKALVQKSRNSSSTAIELSGSNIK